MSDAGLVRLRNAAGDEAAASLHGGQLLSWRPAGHAEQVYVSPLSRPSAGKAVRGGSPVCFPQFSERGPLPRHGFARTRRWELVTSPAPLAEVAEATLQLDSAMTSTRWNHPFCLVLVLRLGPRWLELNLQVGNTGRTAFEFTGALHTYLAVADVRQVLLRGLRGREYEDMVAGNQVGKESADALAIADETDRVYRAVSQPLDLQQPGGPSLRITQQGFADVVVWNPGPAKAAVLGDMPPQDWTKMLCVEAAAIQHPVHLAPGKTWSGLQRLELQAA